MAAVAVPGLERLAEGVCRRAFSSPEAFAYETTIAAALARVVLPALRPHVRGAHVLDVGAGGGRLAGALASQYTVVGVDPSAAQARRYRRRLRDASPMVLADGRALPFPDASFDTVYSSCVFKHWPAPDDGLAEMARVARPGASLITVEIDGAATPAEFRRFADTSRVPVGVRSAYVRFATRTVVGVAPTVEAFHDAHAGLGLRDLTVNRFAGLPFLVATASRA